VPITFSNDASGARSGLVKQSSNSSVTSNDSPTAVDAKKKATVTTTTSGDAIGTTGTTTAAAVAGKATAKPKSKGVRFASEDDVHVYSMKLDDFNLEAARSQLGQVSLVVYLIQFIHYLDCFIVCLKYAQHTTNLTLPVCSAVVL
jgi:hypothetical protein